MVRQAIKAFFFSVGWYWGHTESWFPWHWNWEWGKRKGINWLHNELFHGFELARVMVLWKSVPLVISNMVQAGFSNLIDKNTVKQYIFEHCVWLLLYSIFQLRGDMIDGKNGVVEIPSFDLSVDEVFTGQNCFCWSMRREAYAKICVFCMFNLQLTVYLHGYHRWLI